MTLTYIVDVPSAARNRNAELIPGVLAGFFVDVPASIFPYL